MSSPQSNPIPVPQEFKDPEQVLGKTLRFSLNPDATDFELNVLEPENGEEGVIQGKVHLELSKDEMEKYEFNPTHQGPGVVFLNANMDFYQFQLPAPKANVWILARNELRPGVRGYVLKRLVEEGFRKNLQVTVMATSLFQLISTTDGNRIVYKQQEVELPDAVVVRVGANVDYFGRAVLRQLEHMQVLVINGIDSIEVSSDKLNTIQTVSSHHLPIPKTIVAKFPLDFDFLKKEFEFPVILKKASGSQGKGVMKLDSIDMLEEIAEMLDESQPLIFQEFIKASSGRDLRVVVVGGRVIGSMMRIAQKGFKANVHQGGLVRVVKISPQLEWLVLETVKLMGLDIAGVDLLIGSTQYQICEVNSSPGFNGLENATSLNIAARMIEFLKVRLGVWRTSRSRKFLEITPDIEHTN